MKINDFVIPSSLEEALQVLGELGDNGFPVAGATALQYLSDRPNQTAVDISRLDIKGIEKSGDGFAIGANTTLTELARYRDDGWVLHEVATLIPTHQIRNISTAAGNIARVFPWSDLPLALLVLEAVISVKGKAEGEYKAAQFFEKQPAKMLQGGSLVTSIQVPAIQAGTGFAYRKETITNSAFSLMSSAACIEVADGTLKKVRLSVGGGTPTPIRLPKVESALEGQSADASRFKAAISEGVSGVIWKGKEGMSDEYATHLGHVIAGDALEKALGRAQGEEA